MRTRITRPRVADVSGVIRFLAAVALSAAAGCARGDEKPGSALEQRADSAAVAIAEDDPHAGHDMSAGAGAGADTTVEHADHGAPVSEDHARHTAPSSAAADPHAGHTAPARRARATTPDPHAGHTASSAAAADRAAQVQSADTAHALLMELARRLLEDPVVQRRIQTDTGLRALWADDSVKRHILGSQR